MILLTTIIFCLMLRTFHNTDLGEPDNPSEQTDTQNEVLEYTRILFSFGLTIYDNYTVSTLRHVSATIFGRHQVVLIHSF
jgi:hypothetical protein